MLREDKVAEAEDRVLEMVLIIGVAVLLSPVKEEEEAVVVVVVVALLLPSTRPTCVVLVAEYWIMEE